MKKRNGKQGQMSTTEVVLRFFGGLALIACGIGVTILYVMKIIPPNWDSSFFSACFFVFWSYTGLFIGAIMIGGGLYLSGLLTPFIRWVFKKIDEGK